MAALFGPWRLSPTPCAPADCPQLYPTQLWSGGGEQRSLRKGFDRYNPSAPTFDTQTEQPFYASWVERFPEISCPRCERFNGQTYTVPLKLVPPGTTAWQALCGDYFRSELGAEPTDDLAMHPVKVGHRGRRR
jgi:hypothetical protein